MCEVLENLPLSSLSLDECRRDSPQFRHALSDSERELAVLQSKYSESATACRRMVDDGKQYFKSMRIFADSLEALKPCFADNDKAQDGTAKCLKILVEFRDQGIFLLDRFSEAERSLLAFHQELKQLSDTKRAFEHASEELDEALSRSLAIVLRPNGKQPLDCDEPDRCTEARRKVFLQESIDYVRQIRSLRLQKNSHLLETLLRITDSGIREYHHQGSDFMNRVSIWSDHIRQQIDFARSQLEEERKRMESWQRSVFGPPASPEHARPANNGAVNCDSEPLPTANASTTEIPTVEQSAKSEVDGVTPKPPNLSMLPRQGSTSSGVKMSGYLFRKTTKKLAKTWVRRWFVLKDNQLQYCKRSEPTDCHVLERDLCVCTAKPVDPLEAQTRRFCFQILNPERTHLLQAESLAEMEQWVNALQASFNAMNTFRRSSTPAGPTSPTTTSFSSAENIGPMRHSFRVKPNSAGSIGNSSSAGSAENRFKKEYKANKDRASRTIRALPGNEKCAECGSETKWASVNLGITVCLDCSGAHRGLGVHLSKVKSLLLDDWGPEPLRVMTSLGNVVVNRIFEGSYFLEGQPAGTKMPKLRPTSTREMRDLWIRAKWLERRFVAPLSREEIADLLSLWNERQHFHNQRLQQQQEPKDAETETASPKASDADSISSGQSGGVVFEENPEQLAQLPPDQLLHRAARMRCLPLMLCALAHGADVNSVDANELGRTPLHRAVESGSLAACEFLLLNGAKVKQDAEGRSPLHLACMLQHKFQVTLFAKRPDLVLHAKDKDGQEALDLALVTGNADIVTILRMLALTEASGDDGFGGDETVTDIFRDFRNKAYFVEDCDLEQRAVASPSLEDGITSEC